MTISFVDRSALLTPELREFAERRLLFALSRFSPRIQTISVVVTDVNGSRGGVDKHCRITVKMKGANEVLISDQADDFALCMGRAAERVGRAVGREIVRSRHFDRAKPIYLEPEIEA